MKDLEKVVKATVNGESKEETVVVSVPEDHAEATKEWGKEEFYNLAVRMYVTDKTNAQRVVMKGGVEKEKRAKIKALLAKLMEDEDLLARVEEETGVSIS